MEIDRDSLATEDAAPDATVSAASMFGSDSSFDLDATIANYEGRTKVNRLLFIGQKGPAALRGPALTLALETLKSSTLDVSLYQQTYDLYQKHLHDVSMGAIGDAAATAWYEGVRGKLVEKDAKWMEVTGRETRSSMQRLEVELKGYMTNLIKESIRMGHRDLAVFLERKGELSEAIKSYTKSREYCTTSQHVLEMCLGVIGVALEMNNYQFVRNYVAKAESALEVLTSSAAPVKQAASSNMPGMVAPAANAYESAKDKERVVTAERLTVAGGIAFLGSGEYSKAAKAFTSVGRETFMGPIPHFVPPADIALYAVMTGLAVFNRTELRTRLLENADLRPMIDLEPYLRDVLRAFYDSQYKEGLLLLEKYSARQYLDIHLSQHVNTLMGHIRSRALLSYFSPYGSVSIDRMSSAFGTDPESLIREVVVLIERGSMEARIDGLAGVLIAKKKDVRIDAFRGALLDGAEIERKTKGMAFRMKLLEADILVKAPKTKTAQAA